MKMSGDKSLPFIDQGSDRTEALSMHKEPISHHQERMTNTDQLNVSPRVEEIRQASQVLAQVEDVRETRVVELKQDVENGCYAVKAEHVAERLVTSCLLSLLY